MQCADSTGQCPCTAGYKGVKCDSVCGCDTTDQAAQHVISLQVNVLAILDTQEPHATLVTLTTTEQVMELALHRYKESFTKIQILDSFIFSLWL